MVVVSAVGSARNAGESGSDAGHAGPRLLVVASGDGTGADVVAGTVIETFRACDLEVTGGNVGETLDLAVTAVRARLRDLKEDSPAFADTSVSFAVMVWSGQDVALAHLGDAVAFMLRDGELFQITEDNLFHGCDINPWWHPTSLSALEGNREVKLKVRPRTARMCDRYLLCTGGLLMVPAETMWQVLTTVPDRAVAVERLLNLANQNGGRSTITCVVADVIPGPQRT